MSHQEYLFRNILVPTRPDPDLCVLPYAQTVARSAGGRLYFLLVSEPGKEEAALGFLETLSKLTRDLGIECTTLHETGSLVSVVCRIAKEIPADLVILTRHRESQHLHLLCESLQARPGPFHTPCPVLIVPAFPMTKEGHRAVPIGTVTVP